MLCSVIIPVYNCENYLDQCLDSVLEQNSPEIQLIAIDDCSTDSSRQILSDKLGNIENAKIIFNEENKGLAESRNIGIDNAEGEYILFLDSDDMLVKGAIEKVLEYAESKKLDILQFGYIECYENEHLRGLYDTKGVTLDDQQMLYENGEEYLISKNGKYSSIVWRKLISRQLLTDNGIRFSSGYLHEDIAFSLKTIVKAKKICEIKNALYIYRRREGSLTTSTDRVSSRINGRLKALSDMMGVGRDYSDNRMLKECIDNVVRSHTYSIGQLFYKSGEPVMNFGENKLEALFDHCCQTYKNKIRKIQELTNSNNQLIIYGAGATGRKLISTVKKESIIGIAVSDARYAKGNIDGIVVRPIDEYLNYTDSAIVVVATEAYYVKTVTELLKERKFANIVTLFE